MPFDLLKAVESSTVKVPPHAQRVNQIVRIGLIQVGFTGIDDQFGGYTCMSLITAGFVREPEVFHNPYLLNFQVIRTCQMLESEVLGHAWLILQYLSKIFEHMIEPFLPRAICITAPVLDNYTKRLSKMKKVLPEVGNSITCSHQSWESDPGQILRSDGIAERQELELPLQLADGISLEITVALLQSRVIGLLVD